MLPASPERRHTPKDVEKYLADDEYVIYVSRRHSVVLESTVVVWFVACVLGVEALLDHWQAAGTLLLLAGTGFLAWKAWNWWLARYVLTNNRVLLVEGVLSQRVRGVPLRMIIDTTYRRTLLGRLLGYGDLEFNLSGQPGLRVLTSLPRPDRIYRLVLSLTAARASDVQYVPDPIPPPPRRSGWAARGIRGGGLHP